DGVGLAYADSESESAHEDDEDSNRASKAKANAPPPLSLGRSIVRSDSDRSDRSAAPRVIDVGLKRDPSVSSLSSASSTNRNHAAVLALVFGLFQRPP